MTSLPHSLNRSLLICASRETVFRFFTDSERFAQWWGAGSTVDAKVGGDVKIVYPNGITVRGNIERIEPDHLIAFTYGYEDPAKQIPVGSTLVTIELQEHPGGTMLSLRHDLADEKARNEHDPGWRFQLALFANIATKEQHQHANDRVDAWFEAWSETDAAARLQVLEKCVTGDVTMQDGYASLQGRDELNDHITMCHIHMSSTMERAGEVRQCQGTGLADWTAKDGSGTETSKGTNIVRFAKDGRIQGVVGIW